MGYRLLGLTTAIGNPCEIRSIGHAIEISECIMKHLYTQIKLRYEL